tara:strand:- start:104 stop:337 length:234 start_codon:yes stop_codon:yes gene_type:complete
VKITYRPEININLRKLSDKNNLKCLNIEDFMCDLEKKECDYVTPEGYKIFYDNDHYTREGAKYFGKKIHEMNWFNIN